MIALIGGSPVSLLLSLLFGVLVGAAFALFRLPIPAPGTLQAILGIVGIWGGLALVSLVRGG
jgi:XapX domain-containing protein